MSEPAWTQPAAQKLVTLGVTLEMQTKLLLVGGILLPADNNPESWSVIDVRKWSGGDQPYHPIWSHRVVFENEFDDPLKAYNAFWRDYRLQQEERSS